LSAIAITPVNGITRTRASIRKVKVEGAKMFDVVKDPDWLFWAKPVLLVGGALTVVFLILANLRRFFGLFNYKETIQANVYLSARNGGPQIEVHP
jgi:hypothetical protein